MCFLGFRAALLFPRASTGVYKPELVPTGSYTDFLRRCVGPPGFDGALLASGRQPPACMHPSMHLLMHAFVHALVHAFVLQSGVYVQVGVVGKYGTRYGASLRKMVKKVELQQHAKYTCPFCGKVTIHPEAPRVCCYLGFRV